MLGIVTLIRRVPICGANSSLTTTPIRVALVILDFDVSIALRHPVIQCEEVALLRRREIAAEARARNLFENAKRDAAVADAKALAGGEVGTDRIRL